MLTLGFDPGLAAAGLAQVDTTSLRCLRAWTVRTTTAWSMDGRLQLIGNELRDALEGVQLLAIEDQHNTFFAMLRAGASNAAAGRLAQVVGIAQGLAAAASVPVVFVTPQILRVRLGLGGEASKKQVARAIRIQLAGVAQGISNHAVDACAIALAGARQWHGHQVKMAAVREALG